MKMNACGMCLSLSSRQEMQEPMLSDSASTIGDNMNAEVDNTALKVDHNKNSIILSSSTSGILSTTGNGGGGSVVATTGSAVSSSSSKKPLPSILKVTRTHSLEADDEENENDNDQEKEQVDAVKKENKDDNEDSEDDDDDDDSTDEEEDDDDDNKLMGPFLDSIRENSNEQSSGDEEHSPNYAASKSKKQNKRPGVATAVGAIVTTASSNGSKTKQATATGTLESPLSFTSVQSTTSIGSKSRTRWAASASAAAPNSASATSEVRDGVETAVQQNPSYNSTRTRSDPPAAGANNNTPNGILSLLSNAVGTSSNNNNATTNTGGSSNGSTSAKSTVSSSLSVATRSSLKSGKYSIPLSPKRNTNTAAASTTTATTAATTNPSVVPQQQKQPVASKKLLSTTTSGLTLAAVVGNPHPTSPTHGTSKNTTTSVSYYSNMIKAANDAKTNTEYNNNSNDTYETNIQRELKTLQYLEERNFDKDPTELYVHLMKKDWKRALHRILEYPKEVCTWMYRKEVDGTTTRWRLLPIHAAIIFVAPETIIDALLLSFPDAVLGRDDQGMLPIHLAVRMGSTQSIILKLLRTNPETRFMKDKKDRTPLNLAENSRGSLREMYVDLLQNSAPKTHNEIRSDIINEQQILFEQVLHVVKKDHTNEIEKIQRESTAQRIQLAAHIEVLQTEIRKQNEKYSLLEVSKNDIDERLEIQVQKEMEYLSKIDELNNTIFLNSNIKSILENQIEEIKNEKSIVEKALDVSECNHTATRTIAQERDDEYTTQYDTIVQEKINLLEQINTLERLLQERTESEQALAWQVSALADKLGDGFGNLNSSTHHNDDNSNMDDYNTNIHVDIDNNNNNMMMIVSEHSTAASRALEAVSLYSDNNNVNNSNDIEEEFYPTVDPLHDDGVEQQPPTTTQTQRSSSTHSGSSENEQDSMGSVVAAANLAVTGTTTRAAQLTEEQVLLKEQQQKGQEDAMRQLELERDELKSTVDKLSIKLYKVVGFLDEMVQEQEIIVKEAMKQQQSDTTIEEEYDDEYLLQGVEDQHYQHNQEQKQQQQQQYYDDDEYNNINNNTTFTSTGTGPRLKYQMSNTAATSTGRSVDFVDDEFNSYYYDNTTKTKTARSISSSNNKRVDELLFDSTTKSNNTDSLVSNVHEMQTQIKGVIDSVISSIPQQHQQKQSMYTYNEYNTNDNEKEEEENYAFDTDNVQQPVTTEDDNTNINNDDFGINIRSFDVDDNFSFTDTTTLADESITGRYRNSNTTSNRFS